MDVSTIKSLADRIARNMNKVIVGKEDTILKVIVTLICSGHVLIEDVPGTGKTMLAKSIAKSIQANFKRIQFTPDLLPSDLTGINYYNQKTGEFVFREGPVFTNILLADEINRATPRTQSSLLECMAEKQVTIDGNTMKLSLPFFVIATQNPVETQGTFPLPEAQMDRFFMRLRMGYPNTEEESGILSRFILEDPLETLEQICNSEDIVQAQNLYKQVHVSDDVKDYIVKIIFGTRNHDRILLGVSPRGSLALMNAAQAYAAIRGRDYVTPDDVKKMAPSILAHRLILRGHSISTGVENAELVIEDLLKKVPVPTEKI
ncbi:MAG TPA: magnesium chelatase [Clostridiales bacterium]|nr:magnesium chelatase [Clostridiales bacterium]